MNLTLRITTLSFLSAALALPIAALAGPEQTLADTLTIEGRSLPIEEVVKAPLEGLFEVRLASGENFYTDGEGRYLLVGDLFENADEGLINLTEQESNADRASRLAQIDDAQRVIFRTTDKPRARLTVFTDTTCPYCTKLHEEVGSLNEMGIEVDYLAFPRGGMNSPGAREMQQIWCADNSSEAMSAVQRGETLKGDASCDNPVEEQYHLGMELGVQGTPAIVLPDGRMVPGYVPAARLAAMLGLAD